MAVDFHLTNEDDERLTSETQTIEALDLSHCTAVHI